MKTYFGISSVLVFLISNCYFGWNWTAQSDEERVCDLVYLVLGFMFFFYKPTQTEWHYHVSCHLCNSGHNAFGSITVDRRKKLINSEMQEFKIFVCENITENTPFDSCDVVIISFNEIPLK